MVRFGASWRRSATPDRARHRSEDAPERSAAILIGMLVEGREVAVTNQEKVLFPQSGLTKGDLVRYYVDIAPAVLHHVRKRPMQMKRYPNGVDADFFYQKRVPNPHP